jgi:thiol:disulfide interchange protein
MAREPAHVRADLIAEVSSIAAGDRFTVLLRQEIDPGWHTYWVNPGDSGAAPDIDWEVPEGVTIGEFDWPYPERIPYGPLMNFGYHDQVLLPFEVAVGDGFQEDMLVLNGSGRILVCADICIPEKVSLSLSLPVTEKTVKGMNASLINSSRQRIPTLLDVDASFMFDEEDIQISVPLPGGGSNRVQRVEYFPFEKDQIESPAEQHFRFDDTGLHLTLKQGYAFEADQANLSGVLVVVESSGDEDLVSSFTIRVNTAGAVSGSKGGEKMNLLLAIVFAFLGGLILNLMPCVFPVLSIKILSLVDAVHESGGSIRLHGLLYAAGVIISFVAIAILLISLRLGGEIVGWGFQLQTPLVVGLLAYLFLLIGLNLLGVFEIGTSLMSLAGSSVMRGYGGSFATGILATVVAAPCTAPFMGAAVGYALMQPPLVAVVVFASLGGGMALPYLLLCASPGLLSRLPVPGRWMQILKQIMAFPMFASAIWLLWVVGIQTDATGMMQVLAGGLLLAFAVWLTAQFKAGSVAASVANLAAIAIAGVAVYLVLIQQPAVSTAVAAESDSNQSGVYSDEVLETALESGPVFVNFTAAWCITCKVNEINALNRPVVQSVMAAKGVTYLKGDWTSEDPVITAALQAYGRSGVPLYLLYSKGSKKAEVLPQLLTEGIVLDALEVLP